jgi:hypothetical protein
MVRTVIGFQADARTQQNNTPKGFKKTTGNSCVQTKLLSLPPPPHPKKRKYAYFKNSNAVYS